MKKLKRLKKRFAASGPGLTVGVIAIVLALTGGAIAASGGLSGTQKKEVKKIAQTEAKKLAKQGPKGDPGSAGLAGPTGPQGSKGDPGTPGTNGKDGKSAEATSFIGSKGACTEGGAEVKSATPTVFVCNGKEGEEGEEGPEGPKGDKGDKGEPWTPNGTLPPGATETGSWAFNGTASDTEGILAAISFPIPYEFPLKAAHVHIGEEGEAGFVDSCPGTAAKPTAPPGELCVYFSESEGLVNASVEGIFRYNSLSKGATRTGGMLKFIPSGVAYGAGSFAVTGCAISAPEVCTSYGP
jgi:hypothetical protein